MPILSRADFIARIGPNARLLGLDTGDKRIGVAAGGLIAAVATPVAVITRAHIDRDAAELKRLMTEYDAAGWVVGWPLNMDGTEGPRCQSVRDLTLELVNRTNPGIPVLFWDERLSTAAAADVLRDHSNLSGSARAKIVDKHAASHILQGFFDHIRSASMGGAGTP